MLLVQRSFSTIIYFDVLNRQFAKPAGPDKSKVKLHYLSWIITHNSKYGQITFHVSFKKTGCFYSVFCTFICSVAQNISFFWLHFQCIFFSAKAFKNSKARNISYLNKKKVYDSSCNVWNNHTKYTHLLESFWSWRAKGFYEMSSCEF